MVTGHMALCSRVCKITRDTWIEEGAISNKVSTYSPPHRSISVIWINKLPEGNPTKYNNVFWDCKWFFLYTLLHLDDIYQKCTGILNVNLMYGLFTGNLRNSKFSTWNPLSILSSLVFHKEVVSRSDRTNLSCPQSPHMPPFPSMPKGDVRQSGQRLPLSPLLSLPSLCHLPCLRL